MGAQDAMRPAKGHGLGPSMTLSDAREARLGAALRAWWRDERPAWTEESWWDLTLHEEARRLLWLAPGHLLVTALAEFAPGSPCPVAHDDDRVAPDWPTPGRKAGWPCACQVVAAAAWDACASWLAARSASALVTACGPTTVTVDIGEGRQRIEDPAREELAHAVRSSIPAMRNRIERARELTAHPRLLEMVESAAISAWAGRLVLDHVRDLEHPEASRVVDEVASRVSARLASGRRPYHSGEVNRVARAARLRVCPEADREARISAFTARRVTVTPTGRGMATLFADLAEVDAHRIHRKLTAVATGLHADAPQDGRTRDQLRADVLVDLLLGSQPGAMSATAEAAIDATQAGDTGPVGAGPGNLDAPATRPEIQVIVTLETLLSLAQDPATVTGLGPVPAEVGRALASDGRWRAWVTDAAGAVTATGHRGYVPNAALARFVRAREVHCRFPGCRQPATRCDLDHALPWPRGATSPENLGPLCRRHHNLKTHTPWNLDVGEPETGPPGTPTASAGWRWRTPAGLTVVDGPGVALDSP